MKFKFLLMVALILGTGFITTNPVIGQDNIKVVTTLSFIADVSTAIIGQEGEVSTLITGTVDPHNYEPSPSDLSALTEADLIITSGQEEFDGWFNDFLKDNPEFANKVFEIESKQYLKFDPLVEDYNPHYWLSPIIMKEVAKIIHSELKIKFSIKDDFFNDYLKKLDALIEFINQTRVEVEGTKVVVDHPAFFYLLDLLGYERVAAIEEKEGVDPSPSRIQEIVDLMIQENITQIIASRIQAGSDVIELAIKTGAKISYLDVNPTENNGSSYLDMMEKNIHAIKSPSSPTTTQQGVFYQNFLGLMAILILGIFRRKKREVR